MTRPSHLRTAAFSSALLSAVVLGLAVRAPLNPYDEGLALVGGLRVLHGERPFLDFPGVYPPGQSYVLAGLFRVAGVTVMVERLYDIVVRLGIAVAIYLLSVDLLRSRAQALVNFGATVLLLSSAGFFGYTTFPAMLLALLGLWSWRLHERSQRPLWLAWAGATVGLCLCFSLDIAGWAGSALFAGVAGARLTGPHPRRVQVQQALGSWAVAAAGALLVAVPFWSYGVAQAGWREVWNSFATRMAVFSETRHLPYPSFRPDWARWASCGSSLTCLDHTLGEWLRFYLPLVTLTVLCVRVVSTWRQSHGAVPDQVTVAATVGVLTGGLFTKALSRYDSIHALPASLCTLVVLSSLWPWAVAIVRRRPWLWPPFVGTAVGACLVYIVLPSAVLARTATDYAPTACYSSHAVASCVPLVPGQEEILKALDDVAPSMAPVFIGLQRHDLVEANDVSLYFLAERPIPTRYHQFDPGVTDTFPVQLEIIEGLERHDVRWLVLVDWPQPREPNGSARSTGVSVLDEYIRQRYRLERTARSYQLWSRTS